MPLWALSVCKLTKKDNGCVDQPISRHRPPRSCLLIDVTVLSDDFRFVLVAKADAGAARLTSIVQACSLRQDRTISRIN